MSQQPTVADIFRRAQALRKENSDWSYKQLSSQLVKEFSGGPLPPLHNLTIPEQDDRAPEEDWTAGLPIVRRGIQFNDWNEIVSGILLSLEQTENYERARGPEGVGKWMPEELVALAEKQGKK
jgi:hypothetical protein